MPLTAVARILRRRSERTAASGRFAGVGTGWSWGKVAGNVLAPRRMIAGPAVVCLAATIIGCAASPPEGPSRGIRNETAQEVVVRIDSTNGTVSLLAPAHSMAALDAQQGDGEVTAMFIFVGDCGLAFTGFFVPSDPAKRMENSWPGAGVWRVARDGVEETPERPDHWPLAAPTSRCDGAPVPTDPGLP